MVLLDIGMAGVGLTGRETDGRTERQRDRETGRQADRQAGRQADTGVHGGDFTLQRVTA